MPYEITFSKSLNIVDQKEYYNEDTPELDSLRDQVLHTLANWLGILPQAVRIEAD